MIFDAIFPNQKSLKSKVLIVSMYEKILAIFARFLLTHSVIGGEKESEKSRRGIQKRDRNNKIFQILKLDF